MGIPWLTSWTQAIAGPSGAMLPDCVQVKLGHDVRHNLSRPTAWEAVMRIRCSKGLRISAFHGHFFIRSSDLLALPQVPINLQMLLCIYDPRPVTMSRLCCIL